MPKLVINRSPSAFLLSEEVVETLMSIKKNSIAFLDATIDRHQRPLTIGNLSVRRDDPDLIAIIEKLGSHANGPNAELEIVNIPKCDDWSIGDVCGIEFVSAQGRVWPLKT